MAMDMDVFRYLLVWKVLVVGFGYLPSSQLMAKKYYVHIISTTTNELIIQATYKLYMFVAYVLYYITV